MLKNSCLGLHQSENIQTPSLRSLNLKESNKNRRRSGAHSHSGHIPSQVNLILILDLVHLTVKCSWDRFLKKNEETSKAASTVF